MFYPVAGLTATLLLSPAAPAAEPPLPFSAGETLRYRAISALIGPFGTGELRVEGPEPVRGASALRLCFDFRGRIGLLRVRDQTRSWFDPDRLASLRYAKLERSPLGSREENVEIFPDEGRWVSERASGQTAGARPLDELSFLYHLRTLDLEPGTEHTLVRHFDPARNPIRLRVLRRETVTVPAGSFRTVVVEMSVQDSRVFSGAGSLEIHLSDDDRRIPVRIESRFPWVGRTRLVLESVG